MRVGPRLIPALDDGRRRTADGSTAVRQVVPSLRILTPGNYAWRRARRRLEGFLLVHNVKPVRLEGCTPRTAPILPSLAGIGGFVLSRYGRLDDRDARDWRSPCFWRCQHRRSRKRWAGARQADRSPDAGLAEVHRGTAATDGERRAGRRAAGGSTSGSGSPSISASSAIAAPLGALRRRPQ
jgi:hypothetical protein